MTLYDELASKIADVKEPKKSFILDLLKDYVRIKQQIDILSDPNIPKWVINPKNPLQQKKLDAFNMLKDLQAQKNDIAVKILRSFDIDAVEGNPLLKVLAKYE